MAMRFFLSWYTRIIVESVYRAEYNCRGAEPAAPPSSAESRTSGPDAGVRPNPTESPPVKTFQFKVRKRGKDFETLKKIFVHPWRVVRILANFILFTRRDDNTLVPHQQTQTVQQTLSHAANS